MQLCKEPRGIVYIVDIVALGAAAFSGPYSLRDLLEDPTVPKLFWDCRTDGRALHLHYDLTLAGVVDLQLLHVAALAASGAQVVRVQGLGRAIDKALKLELTHDERKRIEDTKDLSHRLFAPNRGGTFDIWKHRPFLPVLLEYMTDVRYFHMLRKVFAVPRGLLKSGVEVEFANELQAAVTRRVEGSTSMMYRPDDRDANTLADPGLVDAVVSRRNGARAVGIGTAEPLHPGGGAAKLVQKVPAAIKSCNQVAAAAARGGFAATSSRDGTVKDRSPNSDIQMREELKATVAKHVVAALKPHFKRGLLKSTEEFRTVAREITKTVMDGIDKYRGGKYASDRGGGGGGGGGKIDKKRAVVPGWNARTPAELEAAAFAAVRIKMCDRDPLA